MDGVGRRRFCGRRFALRKAEKNQLSYCWRMKTIFTTMRWITTEASVIRIWRRRTARMCWAKLRSGELRRWEPQNKSPSIGGNSARLKALDSKSKPTKSRTGTGAHDREVEPGRADDQFDFGRRDLWTTLADCSTAGRVQSSRLPHCRLRS